MDSSIPFVAQTWLRVYHALPRCKLPLLRLDISLTLASFVYLTCVRFVIPFLLSNFLGWPEGDINTSLASASVVSMFHSVPLCIGLIVAFSTQKYSPIAKFDEAPTWWREFSDALLQFCTGYMVYDSLVNSCWLRWDGERFQLTDDDYLFLAHHFMTSFYMTSTRIIQAGHMSAMICMLLGTSIVFLESKQRHLTLVLFLTNTRRQRKKKGELTNPFMNFYMIGGLNTALNCCMSQSLEKLYATNEIVFAVLYNIFRVILAPVFLIPVTYQLVLTKKGRENIPLPLALFWSLMIYGVMFGSASWIVKCHGIYMDYFAQVFESAGEEL